MFKITPEIKKILLGNNIKLRVGLLEQNPFLFSLYYASEYFVYKMAPFQKEFYEDIVNLVSGKLNEALWIAFRESGKTSIAKIGLALWCICYAKKRYINWDSYDGANSEAALFDIALMLQTNRKILRDFGQLYWESRGTEYDELKGSKLKRISNFITKNGVRVEAHTTQESIRGRIFGERRPDLFILDDIENFKTKDSLLITQKIISHIDEMRAGRSEDTAVLYLGNKIASGGVIDYIEQTLLRSGKTSIRNVPAIINGQVSWPDKYELTDIETFRANKTRDKERRKSSLEDKERQLGKRVFAAEMLNDPSKVGDIIFSKDKITELKRKCVPPIKEIAGLKLWADYNPKHRYAIGSDSAEGVGLDSSASAIIDFSGQRAAVVGTFKDNEIKPDVFGAELVNQGRMFGECLLSPEINNPGQATLAVIQEKYPESKIYHRKENQLGWKTTAANKPEIIYQLRSAVEDGDLEIYDIDLLNEMEAYTIQDLRETTKKVGMTRHYDLLMATAIAWAMRDFADFGNKKARIEEIQRMNFRIARENNLATTR